MHCSREGVFTRLSPPPPIGSATDCIGVLNVYKNSRHRSYLFRHDRLDKYRQILLSTWFHRIYTSHECLTLPPRRTGVSRTRRAGGTITAREKTRASRRCGVSPRSRNGVATDVADSRLVDERGAGLAGAPEPYINSRATASTVPVRASPVVVSAFLYIPRDIKSNTHTRTHVCTQTASSSSQISSSARTAEAANKLLRLQMCKFPVGVYLLYTITI